MTPNVLDEYTVFLAKYGKYIVDEIAHATSLELVLRDLTVDNMGSTADSDGSENIERKLAKQEELNAFDYEMKPETEDEALKALDEDQLAACLDGSELDDIDAEIETEAEEAK
jgi:hypothetical protein